MRDVAARAALLSLSRFLNQGLLLLSPVILVRLLSVADFGRYREFLVYASVLQSFAGALAYSSLSTFVPAYPQQTWQYVRQAVALVAVISLSASAALIVVDSAMHGAVVGGYLWPVVAYTLFFVNVDFWQSLWLAQKKLPLLMAYTTARLLMRLTVVVGAAALTRDVSTIIWSLVTFEFLRLCVSTFSWLRQSARAAEPRSSSWRGHFSFVAPLQLSAIVGTLNARAGNLVLAKYGGPTALAEYTIGTYLEPVLVVLRNSLSEVLLPDMARSRATGEGDPIALWRRATVVFMLLLVPVAVLVARYAEPIIATLFSERYLAAAPVMQIYSLILLRECFDFGMLLRAANRTTSFLQNSALSLVINALWLILLVPVMGIVGAAVALVIARFVEALFLGWRTRIAYGLQGKSFIPWGSILKVLLAATLAVPALLLPADDGLRGWLLIGASSAVYVAAFWALLLLLRVPEAALVWTGVKRLLSKGLKR
jgi:O-antigen/teichoic acid export membrane protein